MKVDNIVFTPESKSDLEYWRSIQAWKTLDRIKALIQDTVQNGYGGIGKPEPLKETGIPICVGVPVSFICNSALPPQSVPLPQRQSGDPCAHRRYSRGS